MSQNIKTAKIVSILISVLLSYACSHPIEIVGDGDVLSGSGNRGIANLTVLTS